VDHAELALPAFPGESVLPRLSEYMRSIAQAVKLAMTYKIATTPNELPGQNTGLWIRAHFLFSFPNVQRSPNHLMFNVVPCS
jgi:hypothetical protein